MTTPIAWPEAQRICDIPEVRESLEKFAADAHDENMLAMVSAIMGHAFTQGRAAGLEEIIDMLDKFGTLKYRAGCSTIKTSQELLEQAHAYRHMIHEALANLSPTTSDAGKDDALLTIARDALEEIALAGMSGSGQESEEGMRDWHARRAWEFIGIAARAKTAIDAAIAAQGEGK